MGTRTVGPTTGSATWLGIGDLAALSGVSASTLRAWERRVGFPEPVRTDGGQRRYHAGDADLVVRVQEHRTGGLSLEEAVAEVRRGVEVGEDSMFAGLRRDHPDLDVMAVSARTLRALTWAIEDEFLALASHPVILGCFQSRGSYRSAGRRWRELARSARLAVVLSDFEAHEPLARPARVRLPDGSPMLNEWSVVCLDPQVCLALVAWEPPRGRGGGPRRFEAVLSARPEVVRDAVERYRVLAVDAGVPWDAELPAFVVPRGDEAVRARSMSLVQRFAVYADGLG